MRPPALISARSGPMKSLKPQTSLTTRPVIVWKPRRVRCKEAKKMKSRTFLEVCQKTWSVNPRVARSARLQALK